MSRTRIVRRASIVVVGALVLGAGPASASVPWQAPHASAPLTAVSHQPQAADVTIRIDGGKVRMPATLRAGRYTFAVTTAGEWADLQLARPFRGYTRTQLVTDLGRLPQRRSYDRLARFARFAGGTEATDFAPGSFTTSLRPGTYWAFSSTSPLTKASDIVRIRVTGAAKRTSFPHVDGIVRVSDRGFTAPRHLPSAGEVLIRNVGKRPHMAVLEELLPGKTAKDFRRMLADPSAPPATSGYGAETALVGADTSFVWAYDLPPGRYVLTDYYLQPDGRSNAAAGMVRSVTLH